MTDDAKERLAEIEAALHTHGPGDVWSAQTRWLIDEVRQKAEKIAELRDDVKRQTEHIWDLQVQCVGATEHTQWLREALEEIVATETHAGPICSECLSAVGRSTHLINIARAILEKTKVPE